MSNVSISRMGCARTRDLQLWQPLYDIMKLNLIEAGETYGRYFNNKREFV